MGEYDTELFKDDYIIGLDALQLGGSEPNLVSVLRQYGDYIAAHPTVVMEHPSTATTIVPQAGVSIEAGNGDDSKHTPPAGLQGIVTHPAILTIVHLIPPNASEWESGTSWLRLFPRRTPCCFQQTTLAI